MSDGGIHLVEKYQDDAKQWVVLAVGPGYTTKRGVLVAPEVKVGDRVIFNPALPNGVKHVFEDGSRWTVVETSRIEMVW
jgi:co-chaperonin GroES (HSP10)